VFDEESNVKQQHHQRRFMTHVAGPKSVMVPASAPRRSITSGDAPTVSADLSAAALGLVLVASFMVVLDFSIVNVALPSIRRALGFSGGSVEWVVTAYAITFSGFLILGGRIADLFGRRRSFIVGLIVFAGASLAAGFSGDAAQLILARGVQGVGAAIVAPASLSLITARLAEGPRRTRALALYGATASVGFVSGQVLGGIFVQYAGWSSIFLVNVPVGVVAAMIASRVIIRDTQRGAMAHLDVTGGILITATVAATVFGVSEGPILGWGHPLIVGALLLATASFFGLIAVESLRAHPLIELSLLVQPRLRTAGVLNFFMGAWNAGEMVVLSVYLQQSLHDSPLVTGLVIAPQGVMGFVIGMFGSRLVRRLGLRRQLIVSTFTAGIGFLILTSLPSTGHYNAIFSAVLLVGFGTVGTTMAATIMAAQGMAASEQGLVGGVINTSRQVGAALGVAVLVAVAEGAHANSSSSTVQGDRNAMLVAAIIALSGTLVALFGPGSPSTSAKSPRSATSGKSAMQTLPAAVRVSARVGAIVPLENKESNSKKRSSI
jgi:EmrB/QacA subfamily drug resistance transporter